MARASILQADESYSFSRYFDLPYAIDDVLAEFDCVVERGGGRSAQGCLPRRFSTVVVGVGAESAAD